MAVWDSVEQRTQLPRGHSWAAEALFALDSRLRRRQAVFEYTHHPGCVFRLDLTRSPRSLVLCDGTVLDPARRIARLHFWNEQIPPMPRSGPTIGWARQMRRAIATSLCELSRYLASRPELDDIAAVCANAPAGTRSQSEQLARIMARYGFEAGVEAEALPIAELLHRLGENILISLFVLAHNPGALRRDTLKRVRVPIYMSRRVLETRFGRWSGGSGV
jgi:hypothetical protein